MNNGISSSKEALEYVKDNGLALKDVPARYKTDDVCMAAVKNCGMALEFVPEKDRSFDICLEAFVQDAEAYSWVPPKYRAGKELEIIHVDFYGMSVPAARHPMIDEKATKKFTLEAVKRNPLRLLDVAQDSIGPEALWTAAQADSRILAAALDIPNASVAISDHPGILASAAAKNPALLGAISPQRLTWAFLEAVDAERNGTPEEKAAHWRKLALKGGKEGLALIPPEEAGPGLHAAAFLADRLKHRLPRNMLKEPLSHSEALQNMPERLLTPELESVFKQELYKEHGLYTRRAKFCIAAGLDPDPKNPQTAEALKDDPAYRKIELEERIESMMINSCQPLFDHQKILYMAKEMQEGRVPEELKWAVLREKRLAEPSHRERLAMEAVMKPASVLQMKDGLPQMETTERNAMNALLAPASRSEIPSFISEKRNGPDLEKLAGEVVSARRLEEEPALQNGVR